MKQKSIIHSPRLVELRKKRNTALYKKFTLTIFSIAIILTGLSFLSRWQQVNVQKVEVSGNKVIDTEAITSTVQEDLNGYYLFIFPKTNFLFYPKNKIKNDLAKNFTRLKNITVEIGTGNTLHISVAEREALYTWCGVTFPAGDMGDQKCYFVDDSGYIFDEAPYFSGDVYFRLYGTGELGASYFPLNFKALTSFKEVSEKIGVKPVALFVGDDGEAKMYLSSQKLGPGPVILFKTSSDFDSIAQNLQTALETDPLKTKFKNKYSLLQYIDLRFGNKVYFKFNE